MAHDRHGRRLTPRGGSPPTSFRDDEFVSRVARLPQSNYFTESQMKPRQPVRAKTSQSSTQPRLPRRIGSLATNMETSSPGSKLPLRTSSAATFKTYEQQQRRLPPVATVTSKPNDASQQQCDSGLGLDGSITKLPKRNSTPNYRSRCVDDCESDDDITTDCIRGDKIKPNTVFELRKTAILQKQDSGIDTDHQMDTLQSPTSPSLPSMSNYDPQTYQKHLQEIEQKATEWARLQEGLAMLLPNIDGDTGFHQAIIHARPNMLSRLLELVMKHPQLVSCVNDQNSLYQTPLHLAVHLQQNDSINKLLGAGAKLYLQDHKGNTPLHVACQQRNTSCLDQILMSVGQRTLSELAEIRNYEGNSCVHLAAYAENTDALLKLRGAGVNIDMKNSGSGKSALHIAIEKGSFHLTQLLVQSCNADFNKPMYSGCTPLHIAAGWNNIEIVAYLISLGADPYAYTDEGDMPIDLVSDEGVEQFLIAVTGM